jgi:alanyl-tRNA synthetase
MEKIGLNKLRSLFLDFYKSKGHYARKSYSLIPQKDKSLLIINSGMAPLKPYFAGIETPPSKRMTTCQKCIRTGDIDNVGHTSRHATFFEMLGSFSFGDYFKEESIVWGWEFLIDVLKMPKERLWPSIYEEDDEAYKIWNEIIGVPDEKIVRLGKEDNFWEIGIGPCGPCSEIYYDRGEEYGCDNPDCKPGCECDRFVEFWNHVFTQFNRDSEGNYTPLKHKNIDTGMGLERLACIMQGVDSIFDVDTIRYIRDDIVKLSGVEYKEGKAETDISIRIITDHIRSITFMVADGILPSNEGRGYVLRRLLRRAARHGRLLGINEGFLAELSNKVVEVSGEAYPELVERKDYIYRILSIEEEKFSKTIDQGTHLLIEHIKELEENNQKVLSGDKVFRLYDTYGFPLELTQEILKEHGCEADEEGFNKYMEEQKNLARSARKSEDDEGWAEDSILLDSETPTEFVGYDRFESVGKVLGIIKDKKNVDSIDEGIARIYLDQTPFYAESGGQASDTGIIYNDNFKAEVMSVTNFRDIYLHRIRVIEGTLNINDTVNSEVSIIKRNETARNHTATHLLHQTLKDLIGQHVEQAGSSVTESGLRFDFTHFEPIDKNNILEIEKVINKKISSFLPVKVEQLSYEDALKTGAVAQFGEKYGDIVRVVSVGDYSCELCGGTHVENSGQIGAFKILSESGIAAGIRRIEAITGTMVYEKLNDAESIVFKASESLKTNPEGLLNRINSLNDEIKSYKKELEQYKETALTGEIEDIIKEAEEKNGVKLIAKALDGYEVNDLRSLTDKIKEKSKNSIILLASVNDGKVTFILSITDDLLDKGYHAGKMIKEIAAVAGGGGGGKADMAQAGAKDPAKIKDAFSVASSLL